MPMKLPFLLFAACLCTPPLSAGNLPTPSPAVDAPTVAASPFSVFDNLSKVTKPLWRQLYRTHIERTVTDREKAALALGSVSADEALAAMARDTQQLRNLIQDEQALEKMLSIADKMESHRQRILTHAESGDWNLLNNAIDKTHDRQLELLQGLRDHDLATLVITGRWLRTWQLATSIVIAKKVPDAQLAISSHELLLQITTPILAQQERSTSPSRALRHLAKRLNALERLWRTPATPEETPERLRATLEILDDLVSHLIQGESEKAPEKAPEKVGEKVKD
jgi:hypothetical protein